jgi:FkbM family methyltransferase
MERTVRGIALRALRWVEKAGNADFFANGELNFLRGALDFLGHRNPKSRLIVFDCGAHVGRYTQALCAETSTRRLDVTIHAFEPLENSFAQLTRNYAEVANVRLSRKAVSDRNALGTVHLRANASTLASLYPRELGPPGLSANATEQVQLTRLDTYMEQERLTHIHFLKLDVEGSEFDAMKGLGKYLSSNCVDFIQFEYGGTNLDARIPLKACFDLLQQAGFLVARIFPGGLKVRPYRVWMDNYDYANYAAMPKAILDELLHRH